MNGIKDFEMRKGVIIGGIYRAMQETGDDIRYRAKSIGIFGASEGAEEVVVVQVVGTPEGESVVIGYEDFIKEYIYLDREEKASRKSILEQADKLVNGDRNEQYGNPEENFKLIAKFWDTYLSQRAKDTSLLPEDVASMMILFKVARICTGNEKADNWIDIAGYASCGGEIEARY